MPIDVTASIDIARPRPEVAAYVEDPGNDLKWIRALTSAKRLTTAEFGNGTRVERKAKMMGRTMTYTTEVIGYEPGRLVVMETVSGPVPMHVTYLIEDADAGARMTIRNQGGKGIVFSMFGALIGRMVNGRVQGDLKALKAELEGGG